MIKGNQVSLRALEPEDEEILYAWENNPDTWKAGNTFAPISRKIIKDYLDNAHLDIFHTRQLRLVIVSLSGHLKPVGLIDLFEFDPFHQRAGIGILIGDTSSRNRGYATEALNLLINYAFSHLLIHQLYASVEINNTNSIKLFEKAGFTRTGTRKEWIRTLQGFNDEVFFQLIKTDPSESAS